MASPPGTLYDDAAKAIGREKQLKGWRREKTIALERPCRAPGPRNAVSGTVPQENSLNQHGGGDILGILRLALSRAAPSDSLRMTDVNGFLQRTLFKPPAVYTYPASKMERFNKTQRL